MTDDRENSKDISPSPSSPYPLWLHFEELARVKKEVSLSIRLDSQLKLEFEHEQMMYNGEVTHGSQTP